MTLFWSTVFAADGETGSTAANGPTEFLDAVVKDETVANSVNNVGDMKVKWITEVLNNLVSGNGIIPSYIQWTIYFALIIAMILIIYNGVVIITAQWDEGKLNSAKTRLIALFAWVVLLFAFPTLVEIVVSLISNL